MAMPMADADPHPASPGRPHTRSADTTMDCETHTDTKHRQHLISDAGSVRSETRFRQDSCRACPNHDPSSPLRLILPSRIHHRTPTASTRTACRANPGTRARAVSCPRQARELHAAPNQKPGNQARAVSCSISRSKIQIVVIRIHGHTLFMRRVSDHPCGARPTLPT
jgi:hypothetical protein